MFAPMKTLVPALSVVLLAAAVSAPADARRGRGSDDGVNGHRSSSHSDNSHGCRRSKVWSAKLKRCVWEKGHGPGTEHRGTHHGPGHS
jgi:hypothetical protein